MGLYPSVFGSTAGMYPTESFVQVMEDAADDAAEDAEDSADGSGVGVADGSGVGVADGDADGLASSEAETLAAGGVEGCNEVEADGAVLAAEAVHPEATAPARMPASSNAVDRGIRVSGISSPLQVFSGRDPTIAPHRG